MKLFKISLIILVILVVSSTAFGVWHSLYHESPPAYRPMIFYDGKLFWVERVADINTDGMEYIGTINSRVSVGEKPSKDFECNSEVFMNAKLYRDINNAYYLQCTNGKLLLLYATGVGRDALITPSEISLI